jgi:hypothetical protein
MHQHLCSAGLKRRNGQPLRGGAAVGRIVLIALATAATLPLATASAATEVQMVDGETSTPAAGITARLRRSSCSRRSRDCSDTS